MTEALRVEWIHFLKAKGGNKDVYDRAMMILLVRKRTGQHPDYYDDTGHDWQQLWDETAQSLGLEPALTDAQFEEILRQRAEKKKQGVSP